MRLIHLDRISLKRFITMILYLHYTITEQIPSFQMALYFIRQQNYNLGNATPHGEKFKCVE